MPRKLLLLLLTFFVYPLIAGSSDPGILLELDRGRFSLQARDLAEGVDGPRLRVALGSPSHPTPTGDYPIFAVVHNPGWEPGAFAASQGAEKEAPSPNGPLGVGKIPFAQKGQIAVHGGADPLVVGKPVSLGCVRTLDEEFLDLVAWLDARGALAGKRTNADGEVEQFFRRPARVVVR